MNPLKILAAAAALMISSHAAIAGTADANVAVVVGGFCGQWRFTIPDSGDRAIGCIDDLNEGALNAGEWASGMCATYLPDGDYLFQLKMLSATTDISVSSLGVTNPNPVPMVTLTNANIAPTLTLNLTTINFIRNGYVGRIAVDANNEATGTRCINGSVEVPKGTTWNLNIGARFGTRVQVSFDGVPNPSGNNGVVWRPNNTLELNTVDVTFTPHSIEPDSIAQWRIEDAAPNLTGQFFKGQQTVRLVRDGLYQLSVIDQNGDGHSTLFNLTGDCRLPAQTIFVTGIGSFDYETQCLTPQP